jgi:hypothetical protein
VAAPDEHVVSELQPLAHEIALALVRQELDAFAVSLNGSMATAAPAVGAHELPQEATDGLAATSDPPRAAGATRTKRCSSCGELLPAERFAPGRGQCRRCRNRQNAERERRRREPETAAAEEPPRPGVVDDA